MPQIKHTIIRGAGEFWAGAKFVTAARICRRILPPGFGLTCKLTCKLFLHPPSQCPAIYLQVCLPPPTCNIPASTCKPRRLGLTCKLTCDLFLPPPPPPPALPTCKFACHHQPTTYLQVPASLAGWALPHRFGVSSDLICLVLPASLAG